MGNASSMLTQYDIEDVQEHCGRLFSQREIVSLYERFCQLDRNGKGFISAEEFLSVPEFAVNPLSQRMLRMLDGLNFKDFVALLSVFSAKASLQNKVEFIFKVYDADGDGKVTREDILEVLHDLSGSFLSEEQRQQVVVRALEESGYAKDSYLTLQDFLKAEGECGRGTDLECSNTFKLMKMQTTTAEGEAMQQPRVNGSRRTGCVRSDGDVDAVNQTVAGKTGEEASEQQQTGCGMLE